MNNRGRGNNRGRQPLNVRGQLQMLKSSLHGHENHLSATNPPAFNRKPFNTIVVEELLSGTIPPTLEGMISPVNAELTALKKNGSCTVGSIADALAAQLDITTCGELLIKIQRIDLWSISTTGIVPTIRGEFFSLTTQISGSSAPQIRVNPIKELEDIGVPGDSAALVSYSFPRDQADVPLSVGAQPQLDPLVVNWKSDNENLRVFARYHLHWNTGNKVVETVTVSPTPPNTPV